MYLCTSWKMWSPKSCACFCLWEQPILSCWFQTPWNRANVGILTQKKYWGKQVHYYLLGSSIKTTWIFVPRAQRQISLKLANNCLHISHGLLLLLFWGREAGFGFFFNLYGFCILKAFNFVSIKVRASILLHYLPFHPGFGTF